MKFNEMVYNRPDLSAMEMEFNALLTKFNASNTADQQHEIITEINDLKSEFQTYASIASVRNSMDTTNAFYEAEQDFFDTNEPLIKDLNIKFYRALGNSKFKGELEDKFGHQLFRLADISLKTFEPSIIDDLKEENKLGTEYTKLVASAEIEYRGEKMNLSALDAFQESTDREVRKSSHLAKWKFFAGHEDKFDEIYDKLVKVRTRI